jgi:hypothetical protein
MRLVLAFLASLLPSLVCGQQRSQLDNSQSSNQQKIPSLSTGAGMKDGDSTMSAMQSMEGTMNMGPHMKMTEHRLEQPGDAERAQQVVESARKTAQKFIDYHAALTAGFVIFHPEIPQKIYHFVNYGYAVEAVEGLNPEHPTALLYEKHDDDYKLIGVMYTAPRRFREDKLNQPKPLSNAQCHDHVNHSAPPPDQKIDLLSPQPRNGLHGSIVTKEACDAAGGIYHPVVFNWMVHLYPFERDSTKIWSVERQ